MKKTYTVSEIKSKGGKKFFKKRKKRILILLALSLAWIPLVDWLTTSIRAWVYFAPIILVLVNILWAYIQSRNLYYQKVKKNPELLEDL